MSPIGPMWSYYVGNKSRRAARELAINVLYQIDVAHIPPQEALETAIENIVLDGASADFARVLVDGVLEHMTKIDEVLKRLAVGWELQRQPAVDRNILRMAIFEILYLDDIPASVSINEAVDLAKKYSTAESGRFVNGVLGALVRELNIEPEEE
jgi:N utilization substance protein B